MSISWALREHSADALVAGHNPFDPPPGFRVDVGMKIVICQANPHHFKLTHQFESREVQQPNLGGCHGDGELGGNRLGGGFAAVAVHT